MTQAPHRQHLAEAARWNREASVDPAEIISAGIGMAVPVLIGAALGHLGPGLIVALGSLLVGGAAARGALREQARILLVVFLSPLAATIAAAAIAGHGVLTNAVMVVFVAIASLVGGIGPIIGGATYRFSLFLIIILAVTPPGVSHLVLATLTIAGIVWAILVDLFIGAIARWLRRRAGIDPASYATPVPGSDGQSPEPARAGRMQRWRQSLTTLEGWQYTLRLVACLGISVVLGWIWPDQHLHWIALTVALLAVREVEVFPVKATQRSIGTALGVAAASLLMLFEPPMWSMVPAVGVLASLRPLFRARNYLAYSVVMTPLIVIVMDAGASPGIDVLADRLVATLIGAGLIIAANAIVARILAPEEPI